MTSTISTTNQTNNDRAARHRAGDERVTAGRVAEAVDGAAVISVLFSGAIFGFFYAWVCSTMWGLDATDPRVAIDAMQAMNASVGNAVFFPAFFGTPFVLGAVAYALGRTGRRSAARLFAAAAVIYLVGGALLTAAINVPMNEELAAVTIPTDIEAAQVIWDDYSGRWQFWNQTRTVFSGISLALAAVGLTRINRP
ncbi:MAG: anthrone oxygenase family protein [Actinomycetota bacterium]